MRISDWSSDVCSSDLKGAGALAVEIALQPVADRFVEQYAGPAGAEQHGELARRGVDGAQIDERLGQRFVDRAVPLFGLEHMIVPLEAAEAEIARFAAGLFLVPDQALKADEWGLFRCHNNLS